MNHNSLSTIFLFTLLLCAYSVLSSAAPLEILSYDARNSGIAEKSVIILGERQAVLIDAQWKPSDAQQVADLMRDSGVPEGLEGIKAIVQKNNDSFTGWQFTMHDALCDGGKVTVRWSASGKHVNSFMGEQPDEYIGKV